MVMKGQTLPLFCQHSSSNKAIKYQFFIKKIGKLPIHPPTTVCNFQHTYIWLLKTHASTTNSSLICISFHLTLNDGLGVYLHARCDACTIIVIVGIDKVSPLASRVRTDKPFWQCVPPSPWPLGWWVPLQGHRKGSVDDPGWSGDESCPGTKQAYWETKRHTQKDKKKYKAAGILKKITRSRLFPINYNEHKVVQSYTKHKSHTGHRVVKQLCCIWVMLLLVHSRGRRTASMGLIDAPPPEAVWQQKTSSSLNPRWDQNRKTKTAVLFVFLGAR